MVVAYTIDDSNWNTLVTFPSMSSSASTEKIDNLDISGAAFFLRFTVTVSSKDDNNSRDFQLDNILIKRERLTAPVTIGSTGYATFSSQLPLDFTDISTINAYIATADGSTGVSFKRVRKVPANTGVLLVSTSGGAVAETAVPYLTGAPDDVTGNVFVAVNAETNVPSTDTDVDNYILNNGSHGIGFYQAAGNKVGAGKAYISVPTSTQVKGFITLPGNDDETGVSTVKAPVGHDVIYNLAGQRLGHSPWRRGVLIQNGKKFIVK